MALPNTEFWSWRKHTIDFSNNVKIKRLLRKYDPIWAIGLILIAKDYLFVHQEIEASIAGVESLLAYCNDRSTDPQAVIDFFDDVVACEYFIIENGMYQCPDVMAWYDEKIQISEGKRKSRLKKDDDPEPEAETKPAGGGKSAKKKAALPAESSEPESEPDIDPTPEIDRFRRNTQEYIRSLDCAALKQDISNRHIQLLFNNYNPVMAEAKACLFYSWKSGKLSSGEKVKNQDFYTINKKSWIDNELKTPVGKELIAEIESKHNWRHAFPRPKDWLKWTESDKRHYIAEHTPKPPKPSPMDRPAPPEMLAELQAKKQALREELEGKPGGGK